MQIGECLASLDVQRLFWRLLRISWLGMVYDCVKCRVKAKVHSSQTDSGQVAIVAYLYLSSLRWSRAIITCDFFDLPPPVTGLSVKAAVPASARRDPPSRCANSDGGLLARRFSQIEAFPPDERSFHIHSGCLVSRQNRAAECNYRKCFVTCRNIHHRTTYIILNHWTGQPQTYIQWCRTRWTQALT